MFVTTLMMNLLLLQAVSGQSTLTGDCSDFKFQARIYYAVDADVVCVLKNGANLVSFDLQNKNTIRSLVFDGSNITNANSALTIANTTLYPAVTDSCKNDEIITGNFCIRNILTPDNEPRLTSITLSNDELHGFTWTDNIDYSGKSPINVVIGAATLYSPELIFSIMFDLKGLSHVDLGTIIDYVGGYDMIRTKNSKITSSFPIILTQSSNYTVEMIIDDGTTWTINNYLLEKISFEDKVPTYKGAPSSSPNINVSVSPETTKNYAEFVVDGTYGSSGDGDDQTPKVRDLTFPSKSYLTLSGIILYVEWIINGGEIINMENINTKVTVVDAQKIFLTNLADAILTVSDGGKVIEYVNSNFTIINKDINTTLKPGKKNTYSMIVFNETMFGQLVLNQCTTSTNIKTFLNNSIRVGYDDFYFYKVAEGANGPKILIDTSCPHRNMILELNNSGIELEIAKDNKIIDNQLALSVSGKYGIKTYMPQSLAKEMAIVDFQGQGDDKVLLCENNKEFIKQMVDGGVIVIGCPNINV